MAKEDEILLRLVIKGMDPAEVKRLAESTGGQLNTEMGRHMARLTELHRQSANAQSTETKKRVGEEIKAEKLHVDAVVKLLKAKETEAARSAARQAAEFKKQIETENRDAIRAAATREKLRRQEERDAAKVAREIGAVRAREERRSEQAAARAAAEFAKHQRHMEREARIAANATRTHWRRTMEDLENFTTVAAGTLMVWSRIASSAKQFADEMIRVSQIMGSVGGQGAFGISAEVGDISAVDIAAARNRAFLQELKLTGGEFKNVAKSASMLADALGTDAKQALDSIIDAMATGRTRSLAAIGVIIDTEKAYEAYAASVRKTVSALTDAEKKLAIQQEIMLKLDQKLLESGEAGKTFSSALEEGFNAIVNGWHFVLSEIGNSTLIGSAFQKAGSAWMDGIASLMDTAAVLTTGSTGGWQQSRADQATQDQALAAAQRERLRLRILLRQSRRQQALDQAAATSSSPAATPSKPRRRGSGGGYDISAFMAPGGGRAVNEMDAAIASMTPFQPGEAERGLMGASSQELQEEQHAHAMRMVRQTAGAMYETMQDVNKRRKDAAGGGILGEMLYGSGGPTGMLAELGTALDEGANMMTTAGQQMAAAMAQALTAAIVEGRNFKSAMAQATREVLKGLATQAFTKAIFHTAEGFGALALGPIGGLTAAQHFKAAAMFGAVGVSAGLGARAMGTGSSAGAGSGAPVRSGGSSFGSGLGSRGAANDNQQPITFNLTVLPGGEAEAGRSVYKALDAYFRESGRVPTFAATGTGP